ncbi:MAG TPA: hypothetical protein PKL83_06265 [bacterium]|nr:hypothetical protein [bacterium]
MHIQTKYEITTAKLDAFPALLTKSKAAFKRSTLVRDLVFTPDTRAFTPSLVERYALSDGTKGLFLRLREENDLTQGKGAQTLTLQAYRRQDRLLINEQLDLGLDREAHKLADVLRFLQLLGMDKVVEITKKRDEYALTESTFPCSMMLDQVEGITRPFAEIHAFLEKTEIPEYTKQLGQFEKTYGLSEQIASTRTYFQILLNL